MHCVTPTGIDLNDRVGVSEQILAAFCTDALAGEPWRTLVRWDVAETYEPAFIPLGFDPLGLTPPQQFIATLTDVRIVVDAGTPGERNTLFALGQFFVQQDPPDSGVVTLRTVTPALDPLGGGSHLIQMSLIFSSDHWDGLGLVPGDNSIPAGETLFSEFTVTAVPAPASLYLLTLGIAAASWRRRKRPAG